MLTEKPVLSWEAFINGSFADQLEAYLADHFPGRTVFIDETQELRQLGSLAGWDDYSKIAEMNVADMDNQEELAEELPMVTPRPTRTPSPTPTVMQVLETILPEESLFVAPVENTPEPTPQIALTPTPRPTKQPVDIADYPSELRVDLIDGTAKRRVFSCMRYIAQKQCDLLDAYASLLPEGGIFAVTIVPNSSRANRLLALKNPNGMTSEIEPFISAITADNVAAFSTADLLSEHILQGEYVFFRTDMHWTPYGAYFVVQEMLREAGESLPPYDEFPKTQEFPFLGTLYRDSHNKQMEKNPDTLDILTPIRPVRVYRYTTPEQYDEISFICEDANPRDRYTVYLGGPKGNWTVVERDDIPQEELQKRCLVITDSYGLCTMPFFAQVYDMAIVYDARFFDKGSMGSVSELIESWGIQDIFMILGDNHFTDETYCKLCNRQF